VLGSQLLAVDNQNNRIVNANAVERVGFAVVLNAALGEVGLWNRNRVADDHAFPLQAKQQLQYTLVLRGEDKKRTTCPRGFCERQEAAEAWF